MDHLSMVSNCNKRLSKQVTQVLKDERIAVTLGGDHSIGVGKTTTILIWSIPPP